MKASLLALLILIAVSHTTCAQAQETQQAPTVQQAAPAAKTPFHRWSLDLLAGPAFPVGKYTGGDQPDGDNGPIKAGGLLELSGTYHLNHRFGITLVADGQINKVKDRLYYGTLTGNGDIEPSTPTYDDHWKIARLLAGGVYALPLTKNKKLDLLVRALGGIQKTKTAGYEDIISEGYYSPLAAQSLPWTFSYQGDLGFKWHPHGRLALIAYGGYSGASPSVHLKEPPLPNALYLTGYTLPEHKYSFPTGSLLFRSGVSLDL